MTNIKPGSFFYSSWGYEQTNIDFYQVEKVTESTVTLRKVEAEKTMLDCMSGMMKPKPDAFCKNSKSFRRKLKISYGETYVKIDNYECAHPWDEQPKRFTTYG